MQPSILDLAAGAYTVLVSGAGGATGVGIVEIFDLEPESSARIVNLSTRGRVGTGDNVMIGGLIAGGKSGEFAGVIARVTSPSSAAYQPETWLADPNITVFDGPNKVLENDNWTTLTSPPKLEHKFSEISLEQLPRLPHHSGCWVGCYR